MTISFRSARPDDFDYCASLYFAEMERSAGAVSDGARAGLETRWNVDQVRILVRAGKDIGWIQWAMRPKARELVQFFVEERLRGQGLGRDVMKRLIAEADADGLPIALSVVKTSPARRLYERLGFRIVGEDDRKFHMRRGSATAVKAEDLQN
ncbi:MAG TPA: GNAT family N-acetyltransferase [Rhizomicrobium sp.]|nr:GNAT family N-acetyltransferase [Rhizomicrobium sp.]